MTIVLPYPPVLNRYWHKWRDRIVLSNEGRAYKTTAYVQGRAQGAQLIDGKLALTIKLFRRARRGDVDGALKATLDALQNVLYKNDSQVRELHVYQDEDPANPRIEVTAVGVGP